MSVSLRIAVADDEPDMRDYFKKSLSRLGHEVVAAAQSGRELVEQCRKTKPDLVITDIKMPEMDGIAAAVQIYEERPIPVILVSAFYDSEFFVRPEADYVLGYLIKPIKQAELEPVIGLAMRRFEQLETLRKEAAGLRQALEERKTIERAKGVLMRRCSLDEQGAFQRLQKLASEERRRLIDIAERVLNTEWAGKSPSG